MIAVGILQPGFQAIPDIFRGQFPIMVRKGQYFVAPGFDRPGFMHADVPALRGDHALPRAEEGIDHDSVRLCSAGEKKDIRLRRSAGRTDFFPGRFRKNIQSVARRFQQVCLSQPLKDQGMRSFHIVRGKRKPVFSIHPIPPYKWYRTVLYRKRNGI